MKCPIRTITLGLADPHPIPAASIDAARSVLRRARDSYGAHGYEVQTVRLSTRPVLTDLAGWKWHDIVDYARDLNQWVADAQVDFCSLGPVTPDAVNHEPQRLSELLAEQHLLAATVQIASPQHGIDAGSIALAAGAVKELAASTVESFGNFRFAALANVPPGSPFFPSAYHAGPASLSIGTQSADVVASVSEPGMMIPAIISRLGAAVYAHALPIVDIADSVARSCDIRFGGIDLSPAPAGPVSIAAAMEAFGFGAIGEPGTLSIAAAITAALKAVDLPKCGYNGLMLPVLEDTLLGERWTEGRMDIDKLLCYSAVCGTGLDTVPLPGDTPLPQIERVMMDVATLALRLDKPLSARLMPVIGTQHGEPTSFSSIYLNNTVVRRLAEPQAGR